MEGCCTDSHVGGGESCKWAKSSQTRGSLWRVYSIPRPHDCLHVLKSNHVMARQANVNSKSGRVMTLSKELKQMQTNHPVRLRGFLCYCNTNIHTMCLLVPLHAERNPTQHCLFIGVWPCPSLGALCVTIASVILEIKCVFSPDCVMSYTCKK